MFDIKEYANQINEATAFIQGKHSETPDVGIICGTGMGSLADAVEDKTVIPYNTIPNFPVSTVESHKGNLMLGKLSGFKVMVMQGGQREGFLPSY